MLKTEKIKSFLFENKTLRQTVLKNTFWLTFGSVGSKVLRAVLIIYAARILGTEGYGVFSYVVSLAGFFSLFSDIGLSALLTREAVKNQNRIFSYISTTFFLKLIVLVLTILATIFIAPLFTKISAARALIPVVAFLLAFDSLRGFGFAITRAQNRMQVEALYTILTDAFITGISLMVLYAIPASSSLAAGYTAGSGLGFLALFIALRKELKGLFSNFDKTLVRPIISAAWPFAIMGLLGGFMINIDTIIIGWFRSANELGLYGAAQRPIQLLYLLPGLISAGLFPIMSDLVRRGLADKLREILERTMAVIFLIAFPLTVGGIILGAPLIHLLFGNSYAGAALTLQLLFLTLLLIFPSTLIGNAIFAYDRQKIFIISTGIGSLANVVFDLIFIPRYGIAGSAVATIISQIFTVGFIWNKMKQINNFRTLANLPKMAVAAAVMGIATFFLSRLEISIFVNIIISGAAYIGMLYLLREKTLSQLAPSKLI